MIAQPTSSTSVAATSLAPEASPEEALTTEPIDSSAAEKGLSSYIDFSGNANSIGHMFALGFTLGYQFNQHIGVEGQVPFYYVSASTTTTDSTGASESTTTTDNGIGDPSFALLLRFPNRILDYKTRLTTWVPVADINSGFTTGSALVDWTSHLSHPLGRLVPFGQVGIANTVPDTPLFFLPYTAQGVNARFEAGTDALLTKIFNAGASFYYVLPSGNQTLYSREVHVSGAGAGSGGMGNGTGGSDGSTGGTGGSDSGQGSGSGNGNGSGNGSVIGPMAQQAMGGYGSGSVNRNGFMTQQVTEGNDLTRDHGVAAWVTANLPHFIDLQVGFNRSFDYDLNTVSFGLGLDPIRAFGRRSR
ncbi:MAG: hypothetical protein ACLGXA_12180 [Acidobacteriota bacterium]